MSTQIDKRKFIPVYEPRLSGKEKEYVLDCLKSNWISSIGKYIAKFEDKFSKFCGRKHGVATSNGTTALQLALLVTGVGSGDEVIVPDLTFIASANAVTYTGAKPVFADVEEETWTIDPGEIRKKVNPRTKAIMVVHLYGHPANMDEVRDIARQHKLLLIEDAAEAHGALYKGKKVGSLSDLACFSFYGNKIITTGEGGMIVTNSASLAQKARFLRDHGMSRRKRYWHTAIGYNFRLTNIQAAIGLAQLEKIRETISRKRKIARLYNQYLTGIKELTLPKEASWAKNVYWMYSILINPAFGISRDELGAKLKKSGIDSRPFFFPLHKLPPYRNSDKYPVAEKLSKAGLNLPSSPALTEPEIKYISESIRKCQRGK
ncbi:MAG: DegT/DnrJ/EryC1/StrS family aminotransferase [Candidatus Ratteibacteria bacterium]|nr:DegT/DnrJ/EryC1/StrS family aminotransferase [Candidatus Ratteibacteria bacterium]